MDLDWIFLCSVAGLLVGTAVMARLRKHAFFEPRDPSSRDQSTGADTGPDSSDD